MVAKTLHVARRAGTAPLAAGLVWLLAIAVVLLRATGALAHGAEMLLGSSVRGGGALGLDYEFADPVVVTESARIGGVTLYTGIFPGFEWIQADLPSASLFPLPVGTPFSMQIVSIDYDAAHMQGAMVMLGGTTLNMPLQSGFVATTTNVAGDHFHPQWELVLPNGVTGSYHVSFRVTTTTAGFSASPTYDLTITNVMPATPTASSSTSASATPTPTSGSTTATLTPTRTATPTVPMTAGFTCPSAPAPGACRTAPRGAMHVKRSADSSKHVASWKWARGAATDAASFGDPGATTDYAWCLYDESGGTPTLVMSVVLPGARQCNGRACWKMGRDGGWIYKDKSHGQSGVGHLLLKPGPDGVAAIVMRAHGVNVPLPSLPLSQDPQVRVRLLNGAGECWESVYTAPAARNDADRFSDSR